MKKIAIALVAASLATLGACTAKQSEESTPQGDAQETTVVERVAPMASDGKVMKLTDADLWMPGVKVQQPTVLDFNAVWCGPCRQLAPVLEEMAEKYAGKVTFVSVDVDEYGRVMDAYELGNSIPVVLILLPDGTSTHYVGTQDLLPAEKFEAVIDAFLAK